MVLQHVPSFTPTAYLQTHGEDGTPALTSWRIQALGAIGWIGCGLGHLTDLRSPSTNFVCDREYIGKLGSKAAPDKLRLMYLLVCVSMGETLPNARFEAGETLSLLRCVAQDLALHNTRYI